MPTPRVLTNQPWADVVIDLRINRTGPLPTRSFTGRRKVTVGDATVAGIRRGDEPVQAILKWTDATGFTAAVVTLSGAGAEKYSVSDFLGFARSTG